MVGYYPNYAGIKKSYENIILHAFPTSLDGIKVWLRAIEQTGQAFENIDKMAMEIWENKRRKVCCEHFTKECYVASGKKKTLKKDAVPTVFTKKDNVTPPGVQRGDTFRVQTKEFVKRPSTDPQQKSSDATNDMEALNQEVLNLALEIICLLTGEDYIIVKKTSNQCPKLSPTKEPFPHLLILERNGKKVLELTNKIIELLTGEVPVRCQDVTVHFSMEEWEYLEGHKDLYKDVMIEDHQNLISLGGLPKKTLPHIWESSNLSSDYEKRNIDFSSQLKHFDGRQFRSELHKSGRNMTKTSCDDKSVRGATDQAQHPSLHIGEGHVSCESVTEYEYTTVLVQDSCLNNANVMDSAYSSTSTDSVQQYPHTHIKEEPVSWDGGHNADNSYMPIDHTYYMTAEIKKEPLSYDEENPVDNINALTDDAQRCLTTYIKEEPVLYDGVNPSIDTPNDHTQHHPSTYIKEESGSCDRENTTDPYLPSCPDIRKEPVSWDGENLTGPKVYAPPSHRQQYPSTTVKEEPVLCEDREMGYNTICIEEDKKDVTDSTYSYTPRSPETPMKHLPFIGHTGEKPDRSSLLRRVVMAHLLEVAHKKQSNTINTHINSQSQVCVTRTSTIKDAVRKTRVEHLSFKSGPGSTQRIYVKKRPTKKAEVEKTFGDISNLTKYLRANSRKKTLQCSQCGKYFLRKSQLEDHVRIHEGQNMFECVDCGKYFLNNDQLVEHQKTHTGEFECFVCRKNFDKESSLLKHQKVHEGAKPFQCPECNKCFSIYYELYIHKKTHTEDKKYHCSKCGKSYNSKVQFDVHMRTHTGERPYGCTVCGRRFMERKKLLSHQKLHAGLNPHECPECGKSFAERSNLIIHRRGHAGHKPAACLQCGKTFSTRSSLIRHIVMHSKLRQCSFLDLEKCQQTDSKMNDAAKSPSAGKTS